MIEAEKKRKKAAKGGAGIPPLDFAKGSRDIAVRGFQKSMQ